MMRLNSCPLHNGAEFRPRKGATMPPLNVKTPGRGSGAGVGETEQASNLKTDSNKHGAARTARRRVDSITFRALGRIGGA
jgi:hypothetical protein